MTGLLDQRLRGITKLGVDTLPLIYFIERHPTYLGVMRQIIHRIDVGAMMGVCSAITLTEILIRPKQRGLAHLEDEYRTLLLTGPNFGLVSIDKVIADNAAGLRTRYQLRTPEALQLAAAISVGCQAFLTNDPQLKQVTELQILLLDDLAS